MPKEEIEYICISSYLAIPQGDIVKVEFGPQVYITHNKATHCTNEFILKLHFEKLEEE